MSRNFTHILSDPYVLTGENYMYNYILSAIPLGVGIYWDTLYINFGVKVAARAIGGRATITAFR
jgi:hypothetical protein